jgi:S-DNA-T family DNA segregation ATPase FtsK/SpoIIIE
LPYKGLRSGVEAIIIADMARSKSKSASRKRRTKQDTPSPTSTTWDERLIRGLTPFWREIAGLLLFIIGAVTLLSFLGLTESSLLYPWTNLLSQLAGWGVYPLCLTFIIGGLRVFFRRVQRPFSVWPSQVVGLEMMLLTSMAVSHIFIEDGLQEALNGRGGGLIGWALSEPLLEFLGPVLTAVVYLSFAIWGLALMFRIRWPHIIQWLNNTSAKLQSWSDELEEDIVEREAGRPTPALTQRRRETAAPPPPPPDPIPLPQINMEPDELIIIDNSADGKRPKIRKRDSRLPPLDILEKGSVLALTTEEIDDKKGIIEQTLLDFGLPATVTEIRRGPAVTQFGVQPGYIEKTGPDGEPKLQKVRVNQIAALQRDLALALAVSRLRIEAPVPGRGIVGVEVPNAETSLVTLRTIIESETFYKLNTPLAVAMGRDVAGAPVATDLGKLPHLLIAGTTGAGKSICLNALITCLVFNNTPDKLKLVMIDPKKVELIRFNGLPHLLGKVEVEGDRVIGVLRWLTAEMDRRYELFAATGAKHLQDYNRKIARKKDTPKLPNIVVFIDELADLMANYPGDVERTLCRLAQMARATGIHLVVATQRPSTDVITGLIKANFPARASFAVASGTDSRVILDTVGAEQLLGQGDMLFLPPDASSPQRVQGCFVNDHEIEAIVSHWQKTMPETAPERAPWDNLISKMNFIDDTDDMLEAAIELVQKVDNISTSLIQRRLRVGYPRAARLMEALFEMGLVDDPKEGGKTRRTFVDEDDDPLGDYLANQ